MATYVVPLSRVMVVLAGALNLVVLVCMLTAAGLSVVESGGQLSAATWAFVALWLVVVTAIFAWNLRQVRRRYYLVRRPLLLGTPAGAYPVRPRGESR